MKFQQVSCRGWQFYLISPPFFDAKSKMFLAQVAEDDHYDCREQFWDRRVDIKVFNKEFNKDVIQHQVDQYHEKIPKQLNVPENEGVCPNNVPRQQEPRREGEHEGEQERRNMGLESNKPKIKHLLLQHKIIEDEI